MSAEHAVLQSRPTLRTITGKTVAEKRNEYYVQEEQITKTNNIYYVGQFP
jgi:hypothetical protein